MPGCVVAKGIAAGAVAATWASDHWKPIAAVGGAGAAVVFVVSRAARDWVTVQTELWRMQAAALVTPAGGPIEWFQIQLETWRLLTLEKAHRLEDRAIERAGGEVELSDALPHVDTSHVLARTGKKKGMAKPVPVVKDLVLIGGGHSHAFIIKNFGMKPVPGVQVTLISREMETPYSGMVPGFVAGFYTKDECHIDLARLARFGKARLIHAEASGIDLENRTVQFADGRPPIKFDVLSIDIGSTPAKSSLKTSADARVTPVKPIDGFAARWNSILDRAVAASKPYAITVVGAGAGGTELTLAMKTRIDRERSEAGKDCDLVSFTIVSRAPTVMPAHNRRVQQAFLRILSDRNVRVDLEFEAVSVAGGKLFAADGRSVAADDCIWCTQAGAAPWLRNTGLALDKDGFIAVDPTLESTNTRNVFAAGDVAAVLNHPRPKAGVFAVRQGPPLSRNLRAALAGEPLEEFEPQSVFLGLIGTGDPAVCVASKGQLALQGGWLWGLKDWIDRKWMSGYTNKLPDMGMGAPEDLPEVARAEPAETLAMLKHASMRCGGCGAKVGATVLSRVLKKLDVPMREEVLVGLDSPDDCAVVAAPPPGSVLVQTVDFFRSFWQDPYVFGQIAANHALSDMHAMGAEAVSALAVVVIPFAVEDKVEEQLFQIMSGACRVLGESNCSLVGGHTCEGVELSVGFCINGQAQRSQVLSKGGMKEGDVIILTKAVGTGTLFAAEMRLKARGPWVQAALASMLQSNLQAAQVLQDHGATSCTDVTGFGVLGHLAEMIKASKVSATIDIDAVPLLPGAQNCVDGGIFSSLQPSNLRAKHVVVNQEAAVTHPAYPLLFDPQTAGGLLASVPQHDAQRCVAALRALGYASAAVIGSVQPQSGDVPSVICTV
eukprot:m.322524 g.322524  ORF g.322524 m.322524 type:complete len:889 (-) comp19715_c0_seq25:260-2926(-)